MAMSMRSPAVLVVDDDPGVRALMVAVLTDAGERVLAADDGLVALQLIHDEDIALVVLDSLLPGMAGAEVLAALRRDPDTATLPVIIVSGRDDEDARITALGLGANDYIVKPFSERELVARVSAHLRAREAWLRSWSEDWQLRSKVVRKLLQLPPHTPPGWAAHAVCTELLRLPGVTGVAVVHLDGRVTGSVLVGWQDGHRPSADLMRPVDPVCDGYLREHVGAGPWSADEDDPCLFDDVGAHHLARGPCGYAPLETGGRVFGVLAVAGPADAANRAAAVTRCLAVAADLAPAAGTVLAPAPAAGGGPHDVEWLGRVIDGKQFRPVFQPVLDLRDGSVAGYEALTRFEDGARPDHVFDLARRVGLEGPLEVATLERAIAVARRLPADAYVSLNVSPSVVVERAAAVGELIGGFSAPVVVEVTERVPVEDYITLNRVLSGLGEHVRVAVDDAGSGYASLSHVLALRPAIIKLDRALIDGLECDNGRQSLLLSLSRFAEDVGATLVAEGVETEEQLRAVRACGIDFAQGFLLGRPEPVA